MTTVEVSKETHRLLETYRLNLSAVREKQQSFDDVVRYLIDREVGRVEQVVEASNE